MKAMRIIKQLTDTRAMMNWSVAIIFHTEAILYITQLGVLIQQTAKESMLFKFKCTTKRWS